MDIMAYNGSQVNIAEMAEIGNHGFPRVSHRGHRGGQVGNGQNGRKWVAAVIW